MSDVADFLDRVEPERRQAEARALDALFQRVTGWRPVLQGGGILGYGSYAYTYASGHSGVSFATGFAARKSKISIYIMPGYTDFDDILARLGKYKRGKACVYLNKFDDADDTVLSELIRAGLDDLSKHWPVSPT